MKKSLFITLCSFLLVTCKANEEITAGSSTSTNQKGLEIYAVDNAVAKIGYCVQFDVNDNNIPLVTSPLVTNDDFLSYNWKDKTVSIKDSAYFRIVNYRTNTAKSIVFPAVLTLNGQRIATFYCKSGISSQGCGALVFTETELGSTKGQMTYLFTTVQAGPNATGIVDNSTDKRIYDYLKKVGKLIE